MAHKNQSVVSHKVPYKIKIPGDHRTTGQEDQKLWSIQNGKWKNIFVVEVEDHRTRGPEAIVFSKSQIEKYLLCPGTGPEDQRTRGPQLLSTQQLIRIFHFCFFSQRTTGPEDQKPWFFENLKLNKTETSVRTRSRDVIERNERGLKCNKRGNRRGKREVILMQFGQFAYIGARGNKR